MKGFGFNLIAAMIGAGGITCYHFKSAMTSGMLTENSSRKISKLFSSLTSNNMVTKLDYENISSRFNSRFCGDSDEISTSKITIVSRTEFQDWKKSKSTETIECSEIMGNSLSKFPGTKLQSIFENNLITSVLFYNDQDLVKQNFKLFDNIWSQISSKNKTYCFVDTKDQEIDEVVANALALSWALSSYRFDYFKSDVKHVDSSIVWPKNAKRFDISTIAKSFTVMRDLVNSPALSLGPAELENAITGILGAHGVHVETIVGTNELIAQKFPQIAAVGMAASIERQPRIIQASWTPSPNDELPVFPEIVIIGKGVTFDTGGLNIKGSGMRHMKKDMAGAAQALALALLIIEHRLPVKLSLYFPIVENSISGIALRPGDVITARNGVTTEITNTDAEGRLILADAIVAAMESSPNVLIDFATLTGAARVALGNDLPALFSNDNNEMLKLWNISMEINDPMWIMPLWEPMRTRLKSNIADLVNAAEGPGGAITAALYLSEFLKSKKPHRRNATDVEINEESVDSEGEDSVKENSNTTQDKVTWFHIDFMGSKGDMAEPQGLISTFEYLRRRFTSK